ncbi:MAG: ABC transporter ATP-binding protein [Oscillospiraceae bacterium]|nr:ABC transporter ATP-binding protein [Oscillospiraceae bacterium]
MIEIQNISKIYPGAKVKALDDVSLTIPSGEFFGLLGPNGAGKTTLISILSTLLLPVEGQILIDGEVLSRKRGDIKGKLALITQHNSLRNDMNLDQIMELQGRLYAMPKAEIKKRSEELLAFCGLLEHRKKIVRKLSGGMKRKLMLCRALLTSPEILILDEPTIGLDPASRRQMWDLLKSLNRQGMTILLTTHYIDEAQYLCQRIALIEKGKVARLDTPDALIQELGEVAIDEFDGDHTKSSFFADKEAALQYASSLDNRFMLRNTTLEDVFLNVVGHGLGGK